MPVALAAESTGPRAQTAGLEAHSGALDARARAATLELYSLESELARVRSELAAIEGRRASLIREQASAQLQEAVAKQALVASQTELASLIRTLYQQPGSDPLAILLGAESLEEAFAGLDGISRAAGENSRIIQQARAARTRLSALGERLAQREADLEHLAATARARTAALAETASERRAFVAALRRQQGLNAARIASIEAQARAAEERTSPAAVSAPTPAPAPVEVAAARSHRVGHADADRQLDRLHDPGQHCDRDPDRAGRRRGRSLRDPARQPPDDPGLRDRHRGRHGRRGAGKHDRRLVRHAGAGPRVGPPNGHDHHPLSAGRLAPVQSRGGHALNDTASIEETETHAIRVLLVDDHDLFRTGLRNLLEEQGVDIVAEASSGSEALHHVREAAPDVVVMDLNMPGMTGVEATRHISRDAPLTRVVVLTISDQEQDVMDAILAGACGYLLKDASIQELMQGLEAAAVGESLISPHIAGKVLQHVRATTAAPEAAATIRTELSDREIQVLKLIANGKDNAMIAGELHISPKTVKNHISNILMKLQIENRIQAAVYAVRSGIV